MTTVCGRDAERRRDRRTRMSPAKIRPRLITTDEVRQHGDNEIQKVNENE